MTKQKRKAKTSLPKQAPTAVSRDFFDRALKRAITHEQKIHGSSLYDCALPEDIRFHGLISRIPLRHSPRVILGGTPNLSPFLLTLRSPMAYNPESLTVEPTTKPIRLNLLSPESFSNATINNKIDTSRDLLLTPTNFNKNFQLPTSKSPPFSKNLPLHITKPNESFSISDLLPKQAPKDILTFFDLPESDTTQDAQEIPDTLSVMGLDEIDEPKPSLFRFPIFFHLGWQRAIGVFVLISFAFVLPLHAMQIWNGFRETKSEIEHDGQQALAQLQNAARANLVTDPNTAKKAFSQASGTFGKANHTINQLGRGVTLLLSALPATKKTFKTNAALLRIGEELSLAGQRITDGLEAMQEELSPTPSSRLDLLTLYGEYSLPHLIAAEKLLQNVDLAVIDPRYQSQIEQLMNVLPDLIDSTKELLSLTPTIQSLIGANGSKRYLLIFQNHTEIRPTGGFMGSFAELRVRNGVMESLNIPSGGTYDLQGQLRTPLVSPWPLQLVSAKWEFQDANWFPDFPTSARQIIQFYKDAGGADVDGVIAINAKFVMDLLTLLGSIDMPAYGRVINQQNFLEETQKIVEYEYDRVENKPKAFIGDLATTLIAKATNQTPETFLDLASHITNGLHTRDIQLYITDESLERVVRTKGWSGELMQTEKDYLMVVNTNIAGGKSDKAIKEKIDVDVKIDDAGVITNTVKIEREHTGGIDDLFSGVNNVNYLRVYVPKGSLLKNATGFNIPRGALFETPDPDWVVDADLQFADQEFLIDEESGTQIYEESGKTVFGNWTQTEPGKTTIAQFTYQLPFTFAELIESNSFSETMRAAFGKSKTDRYSLFIQKQSGVYDRETTVRVHVPDTLLSLWSSSDLSHTKISNAQDFFFASLFEKSAISAIPAGAQESASGKKRSR